MTEITEFKEKTKVEIQLIEDKDKLVEQANAFEIATLEDSSNATDIIKTIKNKWKAVEDERVNILKPFQEGVKTIQGRFKAILDPLEEAEKALKGKLTIFQVNHEASQKALQATILEEASTKALNNAAKAESEGDAIGAKEAMGVASQIAAFKPKTNSSIQGGSTGAKSSLRTTKGYIIKDIKLLANAYPDLVEEKATALKKLINSGAVKEIPGVEITEEKSVSIR